MKTRLFTLTWDNRKILRLSTNREMQHCEGCHFSTGVVVLDTGISFGEMSELKNQFDRYGAWDLTYQDEVASVAS